MAKCEQCGNDYDKSFEVRMGGRTMIFDSFECAIHMLAPLTARSSAACIARGAKV